MKAMKKLFIPLCLLALVACGNSNKADETAEPANEAKQADEVLTIRAMNWNFDKEKYEVPAGEVTITLENTEGHHGVVIEGTDVEISGDDSVTTTLEPGEYKIICSIPCGTGHTEMVSTLVVS
ncbi:cytochrome C oxidase subunit II [Shouchella lonarensis]|uniref:Cytochrome c oxidase subunit 2 n=1 Tax=Shouchella lonarensis TaxID=1464122 RepID=A0A1G6JR47_9BACI|nr:cytochrome C oxidase subunit II [Shouchella lonarensis]SDC21131.1 hypothetical protein SAMN05421737_10665 [Shouchella lonarensis]